MTGCEQDVSCEDLANVMTCGTCGKTFPDIYPSGRCPFEYEHEEPLTHLEFRLTARLTNDAMQTAADIAGLLLKVANDLISDGTSDPIEEPVHTASLFDVNGGRVGGWSIREVES